MLNENEQLEQILSDSGFSYHPHPNEEYNTLVIENIGISKIYQQITSIEVNTINQNNFIVFIEFEMNYIINDSDFCIDLSMYTYYNGKYLRHLECEFDKDKLIEELYRLNSIGLNIKCSFRGKV